MGFETKLFERRSKLKCKILGFKTIPLDTNDEDEDYVRCTNIL